MEFLRNGWKPTEFHWSLASSMVVTETILESIPFTSEGFPLRIVTPVNQSLFKVVSSFHLFTYLFLLLLYYFLSLLLHQFWQSPLFAILICLVMKQQVSSATPVLYKKILLQHVVLCACLLVVHMFLDYYFIFAC